MDKYFCKDCLGLWRNDNYMLCCPGCVAHRDNGWTPKALLEHYGPMLFVAERAYFPAIARAFPPPPRLVQSHLVNSQVYIWIAQQGFLQGFVKQQTHFLQQYETKEKQEWWNAIDPVVQHFLKPVDF
tara:strand:- start:1433 stop:1813 length:381 start_codon:yes stop_codon:yes gene_type:complete